MTKAEVERNSNATTVPMPIAPTPQKQNQTPFFLQIYIIGHDVLLAEPNESVIYK